MEDSEEAKEVSEAPKTSEVKTEVKTEGKEGEMKDNSEVATVDEDQRKLFVGGLAQVTALSSSYDHYFFLPFLHAFFIFMKILT